jgi:hypothetical protein
VKKTDDSRDRRYLLGRRHQRHCTYTGKTGTRSPGSAAAPTPDDKAVVTSTTGTEVNGPNQNLGGTLTVDSTTGFGTSGKFTIAGIDGVCSYTGSTTTTLTGITGCSGKPANNAKVLKVAKVPGIYKWVDSSTSWDLQTPGAISTGETFPSSPSEGDYFKLRQHEIVADARSGAEGDGTVSVAGALALNIVSNHTSAIVGGSADVDAGTGAVSLFARSNEEELANADSSAKAGDVGIGASVALNIVDDHARAPSRTVRRLRAGRRGLRDRAYLRHVVRQRTRRPEGGVSISPSVRSRSSRMRRPRASVPAARSRSAAQHGDGERRAGAYLKSDAEAAAMTLPSGPR